MEVFFAIAYCVKIFLLCNFYGAVGFYWGDFICGFVGAFLTTFIVGLSVMFAWPKFWFPEQIDESTCDFSNQSEVETSRVCKPCATVIGSPAS